MDPIDLMQSMDKFDENDPNEQPTIPQTAKSSSTKSNSPTKSIHSPNKTPSMETMNDKPIEDTVPEISNNENISPTKSDQVSSSKSSFEIKSPVKSIHTPSPTKSATGNAAVSPVKSPNDLSPIKIVEDARSSPTKSVSLPSPQSEKSLSIKSNSPAKSTKSVSPIKISTPPANLQSPPPLSIDPSTPLTKSPNAVYVSKIDAGIAILLSTDLYLIEWPVSLLPANIKEGMYFDLNILENLSLKSKADEEFKKLQDEIFSAYAAEPVAPIIKCMARGHAIQLEIENKSEIRIHHVNIFINDVHYKKAFDLVDDNAVLINVEQDKTYSIFVKVYTPNGIYESNKEEVQVV